jgi:hypothetical protein
MVVSDLVRMAVLGYLGVASLAGSLRIPSLAVAGVVYGADPAGVHMLAGDRNDAR